MLAYHFKVEVKDWFEKKNLSKHHPTLRKEVIIAPATTWENVATTTNSKERLEESVAESCRDDN